MTIFLNEQWHVNILKRVFTENLMDRRKERIVHCINAENKWFFFHIDVVENPLSVLHSFTLIDRGPAYWSLFSWIITVLNSQIKIKTIHCLQLCKPKKKLWKHIVIHSSCIDMWEMLDFLYKWIKFEKSMNYSLERQKSHIGRY